jgi:hypothetical protein
MNEDVRAAEGGATSEETVETEDVASENSRAAPQVITTLVLVGKDLLSKPVKSFFSEHERVYPQGNIFTIPAGDYGNTRISANFNHKSWVSPGSKPVRVRFTVHGVNESLRKAIRVRLKGDKQAREDKFRAAEEIRHGMEFDLVFGNTRDRGYYFVERGSVTGPQLPSGAYFRLERVG